MAYSFTPRKKHPQELSPSVANVLDVPFLLATQIESHTQFLQADVPPAQRRNEGLQAAFTSIFPDRGALGQCAAPVRPVHARRAGVRRQGMPAARLTFRQPLRAKVRSSNFRTIASRQERSARSRSRRSTWRDPAHDHHGSFVINGTERVIVSQLHCRRRVLRARQAARPTVPASCCSRPASSPTAVPGSTSSSTRRTPVYVRIDRRRKMPVTILLKALGMTHGADPPPSSSSTPSRCEGRPVPQGVPERLRGETARFDIRRPRRAR